MFDIGFSEMLVIAVVALVVIGPERLPRVARTLGALVGRAQRYFYNVKADVSRELHLEDMRRYKEQAEAELRSAGAAFNANASKLESELNSIAGELLPGKAAGVDETPATVPLVAESVAPVFMATETVAPASSDTHDPAAPSTSTTATNR